MLLLQRPSATATVGALFWSTPVAADPMIRLVDVSDPTIGAADWQLVLLLLRWRATPFVGFSGERLVKRVLDRADCPSGFLPVARFVLVEFLFFFFFYLWCAQHRLTVFCAGSTITTWATTTVDGQTRTWRRQNNNLRCSLSSSSAALSSSVPLLRTDQLAPIAATQ